MSRRNLFILALVALTLGALVAATFFRGHEPTLPESIVTGNGRLEARQIDIAAEKPGRVLEIAVREGDLVPADAKLAQMDTDELEAQLDRAEAEASLAREAHKESRALVVQRESELDLAEHVETLEERERLVFRVRVRIPPDLVEARIEHVKTGLRGVAHVKLSPSAEWPEALQQRIPPELFE